MARRYAALALALASLASVRALADEREPPVMLAVGSGAAVAIAPLAVGSALFAAGDDDGLKRTGVFVALAGLTLAPALAHVIVREYKRAAIFAAAPLAALVATGVVYAFDPKVATYGSPESRISYGVAISIATMGAVVGLGDTFGAADRWRARRPVIAPAPIGTRGGGVVAGGSF